MEKKSRGKNIVIVILVLAVLGLSGYIVYDKYNMEKEITNYKEQIKKMNDQVKKTNIDSDSKKDEKNNLAGAYAGVYNAPAEIGRPTETGELLITDNKNAVFCYHIGTLTECYKGTYFVHENQLIIGATEKETFNPDGTIESKGSDSTFISFNINQDKIEPSDGRAMNGANSNNATLTKTDAAKIEYANKAFLE